jgi:hypothetical protein
MDRKVQLAGMMLETSSRQDSARLGCGVVVPSYSMADGNELKILERETGFEPATSSLGNWHSDRHARKRVELNSLIWAILGNARRQGWQIWHSRQRGIGNLQIPRPACGFESNPRNPY